MATNIGTLYDGIAKHYDESALGLLSLGRKAAISQIDRSVPSGPAYASLTSGPERENRWWRWLPSFQEPN